MPPNENDQGPFYGNEYATITWVAPAKTAAEHDLGRHRHRPAVEDDRPRRALERITDPGLPTRWVNAIIVDPNNADHVYVAYSGYREGYLAANVFETTDNGATWTNISGRLPNAPVEMLTYDPFAAHAVRRDRPRRLRAEPRPDWLRVGSDLPNSPVLDVKISGDRRTLFAATFGRSVWSVPTGSS